ncbi:MAG TPA: HlyD family efflux transporter periplasmic adaptor subunit [Reyranella sp.]|nr:HlyD family efflux transporter periplasmic adaptor subunit [Reyranella sp.]
MATLAVAPKRLTFLPDLREEIALHPGPTALDGSPSWTLHDPARNQFYRLGWREFEMLSRWDSGSPANLIARLRRETTLDVEPEDVEEMAKFLSLHSLLASRSAEGTRLLLAKAARYRQHWAMWLLKNYLFLRVPLFRPDRWLDRVYPRLAWLFSPAFRNTVIGLALLALYLVARRWDAFVDTFTYLFSIEGAVYFAIALSAMKVVHEMGHALTAKRYGCRVPSMGIALLVLWPVLYTDVTETWKLVSRRERLAVGLAGVVAELGFAVFATLAWSFLPDGPVRGAAFILATSSWISTLLLNLSPFMRFDGYFVLSDWLEMPNLHGRAFAIARWWLREQLFGLGDPPPEELPAGRRRFLIVFSFATWLYRVSVFLGIAVLVYHFAIKAVGIAMGTVEVGYFLMRPVWMEMQALWKLRDRLRFNIRTLATLAGLAGIVLLLAVPWRSSIEAPALLRSAALEAVFAPADGGKVSAVRVTDGDLVAKGMPLVSLASPDLAYNLAQARSDVTLIEWQLGIQSVAPTLLAKSLVAAHEYEAALATYRGLAAQVAKLEVKAPIAGKIVDLSEELRPGTWVAANERLLAIIQPDRAQIEAYVSEADLARIGVGTRAQFHPEAGWGAPSGAHVVRIERANARVLAEPYLASRFGGSVPVREMKGGELVPESAVYRVMLEPDGMHEAPARVLRGHVVLSGAPESLAARAWRRVVAVAIRESGL